MAELLAERWNKRGGSQDLYGEARTPSGPCPSALPGKSAGNNPTPRDGRNHSTRAGKDRETLECERHPFDSACSARPALDHDELESPAVVSHPLRVNCYLDRDGSPQPSAGDSVNRPYLSRLERKQSERFERFTHEELTRRDP